MSTVDSFVEFCESDFGSQIMDREAAYVADRLDDGDLVLNIGCGIGSLEARLEHNIAGIDLSEPMIRAAQRRVDAPFILGDARKLPVQEGSVDAVVFVATLEFIEEIHSVLEEAKRILRPGGAILALLMNTQSAYIQTNLERDGSYFQQMVHRDSKMLADVIQEYITGRTEYFLGIDPEQRSVFSSDSPDEAAVLAVTGEIVK